MASTSYSPPLFVRFTDPTTGAPRLWNQRTQTVSVEVNDEDSDDWENYDDEDIHDEEVATRSNCEDLPPEYPPPDYPPPDFHTLFPESSDQQGDEEIQRKQMASDTGDIDIERNTPENDEESRESTDKRWTTKLSRLNSVIKSTMNVIFWTFMISLGLGKFLLEIGGLIFITYAIVEIVKEELF